MCKCIWSLSIVFLSGEDQSKVFFVGGGVIQSAVSVARIPLSHIYLSRSGFCVLLQISASPGPSTVPTTQILTLCLFFLKMI